jgi:ABC-type nitrate/sulfonate/bicarbonate transport system substrate-binding protein
LGKKVWEKVQVITKTVAVLCLLVTAAANFGCGRQEGGAASPQGAVTILRTPTKVNASTPDIFGVGEELGFFAEQNIKFESVGVIPAGQVVASVVAGKIDVGGLHINRTIAGISAGAKIKAVAACQETTQRVPHMVGVIRRDSPIRGARDLIGKKIGLTQTGGCHEYTPYDYLRKNGVKDPKAQIEIMILPEKQLEQALRQSELDLIMLHKIPEEIERRGEFKVLFSDYDVWGAIGGATPYYFTEAFIREKPAVVRRFVTALAKTQNWANEHPEQAKEITAKLLKINKQDVNEGYYAQDAIIKEETVSMWIDLLTEFGEIKGGIKPEQIYTNEFNPYYKK